MFVSKHQNGGMKQFFFRSVPLRNHNIASTSAFGTKQTFRLIVVITTTEYLMHLNYTSCIPKFFINLNFIDDDFVSIVRRLDGIRLILI